MKKFLVGLIVFVVIWFSILMQVNLFNVVTLWGTAANIGIVILVSVGLMCGTTIGGTIGIIYGLISDIVYGKTIGLLAFTYAILGYICGKVGNSFSKENKTTIVLITGISTVLYEILYCMLGSIICNYNISMSNFILVAIKETIYNMLMAIIIFKPMTFLAEIINKSKNSYYLL